MIFMATRGRPKLFKRLVESYLKTATNEQVVARMDADDPTFAEYEFPKYWWRVVIGRRVGACESINELFKKYPYEKSYGFLSDDIILRTYAWDKKLAEVAGDWRVAYGCDLVENKVTIPWIGGKLMRAVGYFSPPFLNHLWADTFWGELALALGSLIHVPDVVTEHAHWSTGKMPIDDTIRNRMPEANTDGNRYATWKASGDFDRLVGRVNEMMEKDNAK